MTIISSSFGPTILSGEDAAKFLEQIQNPVVDNDKVNESLKRGRELIAAMLTNPEKK